MSIHLIKSVFIFMTLAILLSLGGPGTCSNATDKWKTIIFTENAPKVIGPYSQAVQYGGLLFISGQIAIDPATGKLIEGGIREQTERVLKSIGAILKQAGYDYSHVVKSTCLLNDTNDFAVMNEVYSRFYLDVRPARAAFAAQALPLGALVEIETIACK